MKNEFFWITMSTVNSICYYGLCDRGKMIYGGILIKTKQANQCSLKPVQIM